MHLDFLLNFLLQNINKDREELWDAKVWKTNLKVLVTHLTNAVTNKVEKGQYNLICQSSVNISLNGMLCHPFGTLAGRKIMFELSPLSTIIESVENHYSLKAH